MLAFHGYGQDHRVFRQYEKKLGCEYTIYAIDLFYHGNSSCPSGSHALAKEEWIIIIRRFLQEQKIDRFSLLGFSLGGRFALVLLECLADRVDQLILMAPDGLRMSGWYWLASATWLGNYLLRTSVNRPSALFTLSDWAFRIRLIDRPTLVLVRKSISTRQKRYALYCRWTYLRHIQPTVADVIYQCNKRSVLVVLFIGKHDHMIKEKHILQLAKNLTNSKLHTLSCGHDALLHQVAKVV